MKKSRKVTSSIMVLLILFSSLQLPYLNTHKSSQVYAAENTSNILPSTDSTASALSGAVTMAVSDTSDNSMTGQEAMELEAPWLTDELILGGSSYFSSVTENVYLPESIPLSLKYDDFADAAATLNFNGASQINEIAWPFNAARLTSSFFDTPEYSEGGNIFTKDKIHLGNKMSFSTYFEFMVRNRVGEGGEGFTFTLQAAGNDVVINHGPSMGTQGIEPSVSIEFDSRAQVGSGEISSKHTAVFLNGNYDLPAAIAPIPEEILTGSNGNYYAWIEYDGTSETMEVRINSINERPATAVMAADNLDLESVFNTEDIYAGFTANTSSGAQQEHYINKWYFKNDAVPIDMAGNTYAETSYIVLAADPAEGGASSTVTAAVYNNSQELSPEPNRTVDFSTTFGSLASTSAITDTSGKASVTLSSDISGTATVKAVAQGGAFAATEVQLYNSEGDIMAADYEWLTVFETLGANASQYSITDNLILPLSAPNGSSIIWESSMPAVISDSGVVNRPEYPNHQFVNMTAVLKKGNIQVSKKLEYTVVAESDAESPYITDTEPKNDSEAVLYDNRLITVTFNENIKQGTDWNEIKVGYLEMVRSGSEAWEQKLIEVESLARIDNNKLIVTLISDMKSLRYYKLIIPETAITDLSGINISSEFTLGYKVEMIKTGELKVTNSNPADRQEDVSAEIGQIVLSYGDVDILEGSTFSDISLRNSFKEELPISREVNGNTATLSLEPGTELQLEKPMKFISRQGQFRIGL
jgi:hypothetical protein